jgi:hypothetical protein
MGYMSAEESTREVDKPGISSPPRVASIRLGDYHRVHDQGLVQCVFGVISVDLGLFKGWPNPIKKACSNSLGMPKELLFLPKSVATFWLLLNVSINFINDGKSPYATYSFTVFGKVTPVTAMSSIFTAFRSRKMLRFRSVTPLSEKFHEN